MANSVMIASSLAIINLLISLFAFRYALKKSWNDFTKIVFGSMVVKYFFTGVTVWLILSFIELDVLVFSLTFLILTFLMIFVEILFIHFRSKSLNL